MSNVAMKVRQDREKHPEDYCPKCLWRVTHLNKPDTPCPKHMRFTVPEGVRQAEALAILEQQRQAEMAVITEALGQTEPRESWCEHDDIVEHRVIGSAWDDHTTIYGQCRRCGQWVVAEDTFGRPGGSTARLMTILEQARLQQWDDSQRSDY